MLSPNHKLEVSMHLRLMPYATTAFAAAFLVGCNTDTPTNQAPAPGTTQATLGNGYPIGGHDYQLLLIGVPKDKTADMDNNNGRRIFVQLESDNEVTNPGGKNNHLAKGGGDDQNHIYLCNSTDGLNDMNDSRCDAWRASHAGDFGVIDANATDGDGAIFGLPDPCADDSSLTPCSQPTAFGPGDRGQRLLDHDHLRRRDRRRLRRHGRRLVRRQRHHAQQADRLQGDRSY
jgi:hypothetical protein